MISQSRQNDLKQAQVTVQKLLNENEELNRMEGRQERDTVRLLKQERQRIQEANKQTKIQLKETNQKVETTKKTGCHEKCG